MPPVLTAERARHWAGQVNCQLKADVSAQALVLRPLHIYSSFLSSSVVTAVCHASAALLLAVVLTLSAFVAHHLPSMYRIWPSVYVADR